MNWRLIVICLFAMSLKLTPSPINQAFAADASDIASCGAISGYGFIHLQGLITKNTAGWDEDKISKGRFSAKRLRNGKLDILYIDATNNINSVQQVSSPNCPCQKFGLSLGAFREPEVSFSGRDAA